MFRGFDPLLLLCIAWLAGIGLLAMYSAGYDHGTRFVDHARNMLLAAGILFVVAQIPPQRLMMVAVPLYTVGVLLLLAVLLFGITKKGATRWVNVGVVIQPSEIMKIAAPLMLAWWFHRRESVLHALDFVIAFALLALPVALILKQPDLGTSLLVLAAGLAVIFFAGLPWKLVVPPAVLAAVGITWLIWNEPWLCQDGMSWYFLHDYQRTRVCTLLDPMRDPLGKGFHIIQGMIAIGSGGIWGKGFMAGTQTHLEFIPERTTDFIFAAYSAGQSDADSGLFAAGLARPGHCRQGAVPVWPSDGRGRGHDFLHLRLCEHGYGQRHPACGGRASALYQLWRHSHGHTGPGTGRADVHRALPAAGHGRAQAHFVKLGHSHSTGLAGLRGSGYNPRQGLSW